MNSKLNLSFKTKILVTLISILISFGAAYCASLLYIHGKISLLAISSFPICGIIVSCGKKYAFAAYLILVVAASLVINSPITVMIYLGIFAIYPIIKDIIEENESFAKILIIKSCVFVLFTFICVCALKIYNFKTYLYIMCVIISFLYDYLLNIFVDMYGFFKLKIHGIDPYAFPEDLDVQNDGKDD